MIVTIVAARCDMDYYGGVKKAVRLWGIALTTALGMVAVVLPVTAQTTEIFTTGATLGTGTVFEITDSQYRNVVVESTAVVELSVRSVPNVIVIALQPSEAGTTQLTISGLVPSRTYYWYQDDLTQPIVFQATPEGVYQYTQDVTRPHVIFIQERKSTLFIADAPNGGNCAAIGTWDTVTKTCTLTTDVTETIQVNSNGITLDGAGHSVTAPSLGISVGVLVPRKNVTVKNVTINNFIQGIFLNDADGSVITSNTITSNFYGLYGIFTEQAKIQGNTIKTNAADPKVGLELLWSRSNTVESNAITDVFSAMQLAGGNSNNTLAKNSITAVATGIYIYDSNDNKIFANDIIITRQVGIEPAYVERSSGNVFQADLPVGGNYWSIFDEPAEGCVDVNHDTFCDAPYIFHGGQDTLPRVTSHATLPATPPLVVFIPGLQASRLYAPGTVGENKLWEPNRNADVEKLFLNDQGQSVNTGIYTRDIIDAAFGYNIYLGFTDFLDELAAEHVISGWQALPYDWRADSSAYLNSLVTQLEALAATAPQSQLIIIGHSNGGLVGKELLMHLENLKTQHTSDLIDRVDRLMLVATPQLGTPKAIAGLLHGHDQELLKGIILNNATARGMGENMFSAYTLLPSAQYFQRVLDPVITFDPSVNQFKPFTTLYGTGITSANKLLEFLMGDSAARAEPDAADIISPNVLDSTMLANAAQKQQTLEAWTPPAHLTVTQIAGWGLDTLRTIKYTAKPTLVCGTTATLFCRGGYTLDYEPIFTSDGDKTVVIPSAIAMNEEIFYLNIPQQNNNFQGLSRNREHLDILEVKSVQDLLKNILIDDDVLPPHITKTKPEAINEDKKLRVSVHSPVSLDIYDNTGNHTGLIPNPISGSDLKMKEEKIPNSYYLEMGEGKYAGMTGGEPHTIKLQGTALGTFTLVIEEVAGDTTIKKQTFENIPVTPGTKAQLTVQTLDTPLQLALDIDGNGTTDYTLSNTQPVTPILLLDVLAKAVNDSTLSKPAKQSIVIEIKVIKKLLLEKSKVAKVAIQALLRNIENIIQKEIHKTITAPEAQELQNIIDRIKVLI